MENESVRLVGELLCYKVRHTAKCHELAALSCSGKEDKASLV